jgi:hypothetical protein
MSPHFSSFTSETMHALGQELAAEQQERQELLARNRSNTQALLANAHRERCDAEARRRDHAAQEADARRLFMSELRSGVHALRNRFELARRDMAADFQQMAAELRAAREAFRNRPGHQLELAARRAPRPEPLYEPPPLLPAEEARPSEPTLPAEPLSAAPAEQPAEEHPPEARPRLNHKPRPASARKRRS